MSAKLMSAYFEEMKDIALCENKVTLRSAMKQSNVEEMEKLAEELLG